MASNQKIAIILLAAGASSRMGDTKQLLPWKGTTLLGHAIETAEESVADMTVIVLGAHAEDILREIGDIPVKKARFPNRSVEFVINEEWESGLGSSIATGIHYIQEKEIVYDSVLVMLADQPLIDADYLNTMIETSYKSDEIGTKNEAPTKIGMGRRKKIVATAYKNKAGVPALFSNSYFDDLLELRDDRGAQKLINDPNQNTVVLSLESNTVDIDTKSEYQKLIKSLDNSM